MRAVAVAAMVVIGGGLAGYGGYRVWQTHQAPGGELTALASAQSPADAGAVTDTQVARGHVPAQVPDITLPDLEGHPHSTREYLGHPLIINFWATWCDPCRREIPLLSQLLRSHRGEQLQIVGIAVDFKNAVNQYTARTPLPYPVLIGEDRGMIAAEKFGMEPVLPFSVFSDATGRIVTVKVGELHADEAELILQTMRSAADGRETLPAARGRIAEGLQRLAIARAKNAVEAPPTH
ncbi:MAG TPA: TlpA disulfide reductase family protein [Steroidobacteraceae bacterium]|nr:TlpA disulfide reductase family protein [Steroidobacteraceae bacterium]